MAYSEARQDSPDLDEAFLVHLSELVLVTQFLEITESPMAPRRIPEATDWLQALSMCRPCRDWAI